MKICPQCEKSYADNLYFCLDDGSGLVEEGRHEPPPQFSNAGNPAWQNRSRHQTNEKPFSYQPNQISFGRQYPQKQYSHLLLAVGGIAALIGLTLAAVVGVFLFNRNQQKKAVWYPTPGPTPRVNFTPYSTPVPVKDAELKVEILEKVNADMGGKYLKAKITNTTEQIVATPFVKLSFYKNDVKIKDASGRSELPFLKPGQSVPVWISLYGTENYTSVKIDEPVAGRPATKTAAEIYPELNFSETKMKAEKQGLLYNFRQLTKLYYKVEGIVENTDREKISVKLYVLYLDGQGEIVGLAETRLGDLKRNEKTKFEVTECEIDLYGVPKTFEVIAVSE
jgi:hypothetical protein